MSDVGTFLEPPPHGWTCFHCGETFPSSFEGQRNARHHFGETPDAEPACLTRCQEVLATSAKELIDTRAERDSLREQLAQADAVLVEGRWDRDGNPHEVNERAYQQSCQRYRDAARKRAEEGSNG